MKLQILLSDTPVYLALMAADHGLLRLLARGKVAWLNAAWEERLCQQFGIPQQQDWPMAALARLGQQLPVDEAYWMLATPVHLLLQRDSFLLAEPAPVALCDTEEEALRTSLNQHFAGEGFELLPGGRGHWHMRFQVAPELATTPLSIALGRDISPWLPQGRDAQCWRQCINEMQMLLFNHPVNQARELRGEPVVNSLWLHGGGVLPKLAPVNTCQVYSHDASVRGMARLAGLAHADIASLRAILHEARGNVLLQATYNELEAGWSELLWQTLKTRRVQALTISFPWFDRMLQLHLTPIDIWKFWRKPKALEAYFDGR